MQITDPIADMLTRIRNANSAKHETVDVPVSNMKKAIALHTQEYPFILSMENAFSPLAQLMVTRSAT